MTQIFLAPWRNSAVASISEQSPPFQILQAPGERLMVSEDRLFEGLSIPPKLMDALASRVQQWLVAPTPLVIRDRVMTDAAGLPMELRHELQRRVTQLWFHLAENGMLPIPDARTRENRTMVETESMAKADRPPGNGWAPIPGGRGGGFRRPKGQGWEFWYPGRGVVAGEDRDVDHDEWVARDFEKAELVAILEESELVKGAGHKYLKRFPNPSGHPHWRYVYKLPKGRHLVVEEHLVTGAKLKGEYQGQVGHFEVTGQPKPGFVTLRHDETGKTLHISTQDLHRMVESYHRRAGTAGGPKPEARSFPAPKPGAEEKHAPKLHEISLRDLPVWQEVVGFAADRKAAEALAASSKQAGTEFGVVEQRNGFLVCQRRARKPGKVQEGDMVSVAYKTARGIELASGTYMLMEAGEVIPSHKPGMFAENPVYPRGVQERVYHSDVSEQNKVRRIAEHLDPRFLVNSNTDGVNGPPVITQDGIVLGGNGRCMGIQTAYHSVPESAAAYKEYLSAKAADYGFSSHDVETMKQPILVRRIKVPDDQAKMRMWARVLNDSLTQGMDPRTEEVALATNYVTDDLVSILAHDMPETDTMGKFLGSEASRPLVRAMIGAGILDEFNQAKYLHLDENHPQRGLLNEDGRARVQRILVASIMPDSRVLKRMPSTALEALARSVPSVFRAKMMGWDLTPSFRTAVDAYLDAQDSGAENAASYLRGVAAEGMGSEPLARVQKDPTAQALLGVLYKVGKTKTPRGFREFASRAARAQKIREQSTGLSLFGAEPGEEAETPTQALDVAFGLSKEGQKQRETEAEQREAEAHQDVERQAVEAGMNSEQWAAYQEWSPLAEKAATKGKPAPEMPAVLQGVKVGDATRNQAAYNEFVMGLRGEPSLFAA